MAPSRLYIGCKIWLISKAQNRYEGILYTIDVRSSILVLAKVRCLGTEGRPTERPTPPQDIIYDFITFSGNDIEDIALCEPMQYELHQDPAIVQSSGSCFSSPVGFSAYDQLAASTLLNQHYAAVLGHIPGLQVQRGPMVEKAVQTLQQERCQQRRSFSGLQEQPFDRRKPQRIRESTSVTTSLQAAWQKNWKNRPPTRRPGPQRPWNRGRGQLGVAHVPVPILKFDTDFDFDLSNAQFIKDQVSRELQSKVTIKDGNYENRHEKEGLQLNAQDGNCEPKWYYDKAKSFFDNISSNGDFRLTWAEERKRNLETFGFPGHCLRSQSFRGGYSGGRGRGTTLLAQ